MAKVRSWAGLDVHARSVLAVTMDADTAEICRQRLSADITTVVEFLVGLPGRPALRMRPAPTGQGLAGVLHAGDRVHGGGPGKIERPAQDKIKTDARDGERLLRLLMIDALVLLRVPTVEEEAIRDLVCAGGRPRRLMRWRQRLSLLRLRHAIMHEDTSSTWTQKHRAWIVDPLPGSRRRCAGHAARSPRRDRHARVPPRSAREDDQRARPRFPRTRTPSPGSDA